MRPIPSLHGIGWAALFVSQLVKADSPTIDLSNGTDIQAAAVKALTILLGYYTVNDEGVFDTVQTPWHESGMIWNMFYDYTKWTGDSQFDSLVTSALVNTSFGDEMDFLDGAQAATQGLIGKWNDDILWPAQALITAGENLGANTTVPGQPGDWLVTPQKTLDQVYEQWDDECNGGIYWSRNRNSDSANYKSVITNLEYVQTAARVYLQNQNETILSAAEATLAWLFDNGLGSVTTGMIYDGVSTTNCLSITGSQWTYNYGELLGALAWMHKATGNATYLEWTSPFLATVLSTFAPDGVILETCETDVSCNRDQQGFKAVLVRNLAYLARQTTVTADIQSIQTTIGTTVAAMVKNSCDENWNCGGNWTTDTGAVKYVRSQHVSSALLVAALGIYQNETGTGLLPDSIDAPAPTTNFTTPTGVGSASSACETSSSGYVVSCPLDGSAQPSAPWPIGAALGLVAMLVALSL